MSSYKGDTPSPLASVLVDLAVPGKAFGISIWELSTGSMLGDVMNGIRGSDGHPRHIKEGYQYVGGFPAKFWRDATSDVLYKLLSYGIRTFPKRWERLRDEITQPVNYVSIGPGTGEKDREILRRLLSVAEGQQIVYMPVDISMELLKMTVAEVAPEAYADNLTIVPIQLDLTSHDAMKDLKPIISELSNEHGTLVSVLGNTLANFRDDRGMLERIASLLGEKDLLLIEVGTAAEATASSAEHAKSEYEGSLPFRKFVMATLCDLTDIDSNDTDGVVYDHTVENGSIKVTANYRSKRTRSVHFRDGQSFRFPAGEKIELLITRKYTKEALAEMLANFEEVRTSSSDYDRGNFGLVTKLLRHSAAPPHSHAVAG